MDFPLDAPQYHFEPQHLPSVLDGMVVLPNNSKNKPSNSTYLWMELPEGLARQAVKASGLSYETLLQQSVTPSVYVPITPALKSAIEATSILKANGADCYLKVSENGAVRMKYQQIIGGRSLTPPDPSLLENIMNAIVPRLLANKDFTNPVEVFRPGLVDGPGQLIKGSERMSARLSGGQFDLSDQAVPSVPRKSVDLSGVLDNLVVTVYQDYKSRPSRETHLWLDVSQKVLAQAIDKAGMDRSELLGHSSMPHVFVPITPALRSALNTGSTQDAKPNFDNPYLVLGNDGAIAAKMGVGWMKQVLASEAPGIVDTLTTLIAGQMKNNPGFTNPQGKYGRQPEFETLPIEPSKPLEKPSVMVRMPSANRTFEMFPDDAVPAPIKSTGVVSRSPVSPALSSVSGARASNAPASVLADLSQLQVDPLNAQHLKLPTTHLENYAEVKALLTKAGGKYNSKGYFAFPLGIEPAQVHKALMAGAAVNGKKDVQFFATPPDVAQMLCDNAGPMKGLRVLEPSAGDGALADIARARGADVTVIENWPVNVVKLKAKGYDVIDKDFLTVTPGEIGLFDVILANPPFTKNQDIDHVRHMMDFLEPGGVLSVITSQSWANGSQKKQQEFAEFLSEMEAVITPVEAGAFKASGTGISTFQIVLRAPPALGLKDDIDNLPARKSPRP